LKTTDSRVPPVSETREREAAAAGLADLGRCNAAGPTGSADSAHSAKKIKQAGRWLSRPPTAGKLLLLFFFLFTCFQKYLKYILIQNKIK
jgi:hypothetical protein